MTHVCVRDVPFLTSKLFVYDASAIFYNISGRFSANNKQKVLIKSACAVISGELLSIEAALINLLRSRLARCGPEIKNLWVF